MDLDLFSLIPNELAFVIARDYLCDAVSFRSWLILNWKRVDDNWRALIEKKKVILSKYVTLIYECSTNNVASNGWIKVGCRESICTKLPNTRLSDLYSPYLEGILSKAGITNTIKTPTVPDLFKSLFSMSIDDIEQFINKLYQVVTDKNSTLIKTRIFNRYDHYSVFGTEFMKIMQINYEALPNGTPHGRFAILGSIDGLFRDMVENLKNPIKCKVKGNIVEGKIQGIVTFSNSQNKNYAMTFCKYKDGELQYIL